MPLNNASHSEFDVVVDLSNACRDRTLGYAHGPALWARWEKLRGAWLRRTPELSRILLVADDNLRRKLTAGDVVQYDRHEDLGDLITGGPSADSMLLQLAQENSALVLSRDAFTEQLRTPGVSSLIVLRWEVRGSEVHFSTRSMNVPLSAVMSERDLKQLMKAQGLQTDDPVLRFRWSCRDVSCCRDIVLVPKVSPSAPPACPTCGGFLDRGQAWIRPVAVKVKVGSADPIVLWLEDGESRVIGRGEHEGSLDLSALLDEGSGRDRVSRRHLRLTNSQGQLVVEDLGSTCGTAVATPIAKGDKPQRQWLPRADLPANTPRVLHRGERLYLARTKLFVELSGQRAGS